MRNSLLDKATNVRNERRKRDWERIQADLPEVADMLKTFGKPKHMRVEFSDGHIVESGEQPTHEFWNGKLRPCTKPEPSWLQAKRNGNKR